MGRTGIGLLVLLLAVRLLVPSGWMPAGDSRFGIVPCIGVASPEAGAGHHGNAHGKAPAPAASPDHPCAFAGLGAPMLAPPDPSSALSHPPIDASVVARMAEVAIGRRLAAPPPPSTGPPTGS